MTAAVKLAAQPAPEVVISLAPEFVDYKGSPTAEWARQFTPNRDRLSEPPALMPLNLPAAALRSSLFMGIYRCRPPEGLSGVEYAVMLTEMEGVQWAEASPVRYTSEIRKKVPAGTDAPPSDPYYHLQWALHKIHAAAAWDITHGDSSVVIAVIDDGVDLEHGDLAEKIYINPAERYGQDNIDDDQNGFIDDINGWDFYQDDADPRPAEGDEHGTHVSGIAAAATGNAYGMAGMAWDCRLMPVRAGRRGVITNGYEGVVYAAAAGADIINLSWGSGTPSHVERVALDYALELGCVVVAAAGNLSSKDAHYPAAYDDVLGVAATDADDRLAWFSNFGEWVGISAPGEDILSTLPDGKYGLNSGTSMATPLVAGAAALVKSLHPDWTPQQIINQLVNSADPVDAINPGHSGELGGGRLNVFRALWDANYNFELLTVSFDDTVFGNGSGFIDPGENIDIYISFTGSAPRPILLTGKIETDSRNLGITISQVELGEFRSGDMLDNQHAPFRCLVSPRAVKDERIPVRLVLSAAEFPDRTQHFELHVRPKSATHNNGSIAVTLTDFGAIGYNDYEAGVSRGVGFRYGKGALSGLFHGSLMLGTSPDRVSDNAYGNDNQDRFDFSSNLRGFKVETQPDGSQISYTLFTDSESDRPLNIEVEQFGYTFPQPPHDDFLILEYRLNNVGARVDSLYVGLYLDWDVVDSDENTLHWSPPADAGWMAYRHSGFPVFGAAVLQPEANFHVAVNNRVLNQWGDSLKMEYLLKDFRHLEGEDTLDWSQMIGVGPLSLSSNARTVVVFTLAAGDSTADFLSNVFAARSLWEGGFNWQHPHAFPAYIELLSVYPSPFNSGVTVKYRANRSFEGRWDIYDLQGRLALTGGKLYHAPGSYLLPIDAAGLPSGRYVLTLNSSGGSLRAPLTRVK